MNTRANERECYGNLFPDFTALKLREPLEGKAFTAVVAGSGTGARGRNLEVKREGWAKCVECPDYRTCYDLSVAKLLMNYVVMNTLVANPWVGEPARKPLKKKVTRL
jgi:hypothetical protein